MRLDFAGLSHVANDDCLPGFECRSAKAVSFASFQTGHLIGHLGIVIVLAHWSLHYDIDIVVIAMTANLVTALNGDAGPLAVGGFDGHRCPAMPCVIAVNANCHVFHGE